MRIVIIFLAILGLLFNYYLPQLGAQESPKMKMTTEIPEGIATPDKLETSIGTLTSFDGVPDKKTTQIVYDNLDLQRAVQAFLSTIQIASMYAWKKVCWSLARLIGLHCFLKI